MRFSRVLLPAVFVLATPLVFAATREKTTVEVVQVPVYIRTGAGSVRGLTRDNFDLRVNGKPQQIDYFDVVDFATLSGEQARDPRQRRLYVLMFDLINTSPASVLRAKRAAEKYLAGAQASDYFAVALLDRYHGIEFIVPFTRDQATLRRAVASFSASSPDDPLRLTVTPAERAIFINDTGRDIADLRRAGGDLAAAMAIEAGRSRVADELDDLGDLAQRLAPLEGFKHVILLSHGFSNALLANSRQRANYMGLPEVQPASYRSTLIPSSFGSELPFAQQNMRKKFAAAGVFLDAIDTSGIPPYDTPRNDSLHYMLADTGGQIVELRNDLAGALQHLTDSQQVVYLLGFHAPATGRKQNAISVRVNGAPRGSTVAYRQSYESFAQSFSSTDGLRLADVVINDIPQNGVTMTTSVVAAPKRATVNVTIPGRELLALAGNDTTLTGEALIYVFNGQTSVAFAKKAIDIDVPRAGGLSTSNVEITHTFDLPPGTYAMKVLVRIQGQDTLAFARRDFAVEE